VDLSGDGYQFFPQNVKVTRVSMIVRIKGSVNN